MCEQIKWYALCLFCVSSSLISIAHQKVQILSQVRMPAIQDMAQVQSVTNEIGFWLGVHRSGVMAQVLCAGIVCMAILLLRVQACKRRGVSVQGQTLPS